MEFQYFVQGVDICLILPYYLHCYYFICNRNQSYAKHFLNLKTEFKRQKLGRICLPVYVNKLKINCKGEKSLYTSAILTFVIEIIGDPIFIWNLEK